MDLKSVSINEKGHIFLDGEEIKNVLAYKLEDSAGRDEPAKLTVTMYVTVDRVCFGTQEKEGENKVMFGENPVHEFLNES